MNKKIIFTAGGTGGHLFPAINLMQYFSNKGYEVLLVTDIRGEKFLKKQNESRFNTIKIISPTGKNFIKKIFSITTIIISILKCLIIIKKEKPSLIFGLGGYVSFPISYASKFLNIPLIIYENNFIIGRANKKLLSISKKLLLSDKIPINLPSKYEKKTYKVGNILSEEILNSSINKKNHPKILTILVLGGSQGAKIFGEVIPPTIKKLKEKGFEIQINQQCTAEQKDLLIKFYNENNIKNNVFDFSNNILDLLLSSNLAISRCGASTTAELVQTLTPFIAIPYPHSTDNHQYLNAKHYEEKGCCWLLKESNFNSDKLHNLILEILNDKNKLEKTQQNMKKNDNKSVYTKVEKVLEEFIK